MLASGIRTKNRPGSETRVETRGAFGAAWPLHDLDEQLVTALHEIADVEVPLVTPPEPSAFFVVLGQNVGDIQKRVAFQADLDERGIHALQHIVHAGFIEIPDDPLFTFDVQFGQLLFVQNGDAGSR